MLEPARVVPVDQLRADDARVAAVQLLHQDSDGARFEGDVVVEEAEETILALDQVEDLVRRGAETGVPIDCAHESGRHPATDDGRQLAGLSGDEEQKPEIRVVLPGKCIEHFVEPRTGLMDDHHRHYGRSE